MTIQFTKMQGAGNDYIYVNTINQPVTNPVSYTHLTLPTTSRV